MREKLSYKFRTEADKIAALCSLHLLSRGAVQTAQRSLAVALIACDFIEFVGKVNAYRYIFSRLKLYLIQHRAINATWHCTELCRERLSCPRRRWPGLEVTIKASH